MSAFTGEPTDENGLVYLRARYYHPALGVFPSLDPVEFVNRYGYVGGNPINRVDPSGLIGERPIQWDQCLNYSNRQSIKHFFVMPKSSCPSATTAQEKARAASVTIRLRNYDTLCNAANLENCVTGGIGVSNQMGTLTDYGDGGIVTHTHYTGGGSDIFGESQEPNDNLSAIKLADYLKIDGACVILVITTESLLLNSESTRESLYLQLPGVTLTDIGVPVGADMNLHADGLKNSNEFMIVYARYSNIGATWEDGA